MTEQEVSNESNGQENNAEENDSENNLDLEKAIVRQIEYYFGDANLPRDKFLHEQVKLDEGWVPLDILIRFNRLNKLTTDLEVIANAINKSTSALLELSDDNKKVRRNPEMPVPEMNEDRRKALVARTVYVKGFPKDAVLDDLLKFFKEYDEVENVIMRRYQNRQTKKRHFKGSLFATFKDKEQAEKFVNTKDLKYGDTELIIRWQEDYLKEKQEEYAARKQHKEKKTIETKEEKEEFKLPTGTVLHFPGNEKLNRENIKATLLPMGADIAFIDFKVGDKEGWVRFAKENAAIELADKLTDGKIKIADTDVEFRLLEGEEETAYLAKTVEEMIKRRKNQKNSKQQKGKNPRGKGRKRKQGANDDAPPAKVKTDS